MWSFPSFLLPTQLLLLTTSCLPHKSLSFFPGFFPSSHSLGPRLRPSHRVRNISIPKYVRRNSCSRSASAPLAHSNPSSAHLSPTSMPVTDPRCSWAASAPDYLHYHDTEWGIPVYDDALMFEHLLLETFQSGLNWLLILRRRAAFRKAFHDFDTRRIATMTDADVERLVNDPTIIRHRAKICAAIANARAVLQMWDEESLGLAEYFWSWAGFKQMDAGRRSVTKMPSWTPLSERISDDLKRRGFRFVGKTIVYAHLQATGIVNDHIIACPGYERSKGLVWSEEKWRERGVVVGIRSKGISVRERKEVGKGVRKRTRKVGDIEKNSKVSRGKVGRGKAGRGKVARPVGEGDGGNSASVRRSKRLAGEPME